MSQAQSEPVGIIGLGIMGSAIGDNLIAAGYPVVGYDIAAPALKALAARGGAAAKSATEVAARAAILITSLPSAKALHDVVGELAATPRQSCVLAETSTLALDDKLAAADVLRAANIVMLDCPLSGSGSQALVRDVLVYGSGDRSAYDRCLPVFQAFSRAPSYLGPFGNGSKMKYIANLLVAIHTVAAGEAFALARKAGLDPQQMFEVVSDGAGGSSALKTRGEMLIADRYLPIATMPLDLWRKDLRVITEFATGLCAPTPMFAAAVALFNAAIASGYGNLDTAAVALVLEHMAGLRAEDR
jgi:3-hydroxyisobutyrate dehydrogenase-like beta-hydroxyacid dehydrogenase